MIILNNGIYGSLSKSRQEDILLVHDEKYFLNVESYFNPENGDLNPKKPLILGDTYVCD